MKKILVRLSSLALKLIFSSSLLIITPAVLADPMFVLGKHISGWHNTTYQFDTAFSGLAVIGVSNENAANNSKLLLDNITGSSPVISPNAFANGGFENGNLSGFSQSDNDADPDDGAIRLVDNVHGNGQFDVSFNDVRDENNNYIGTVNMTPLTGQYAAFLDSFGADTSAFKNANGESGTTGSYLYFDVNAASGDSITFDWNFFSDELFTELNNNDFAFLRLVAGNDPANITTANPFHHEVIAQVGANPVPLPMAFWLFLSGVGSLIAFSRKNDLDKYK